MSALSLRLPKSIHAQVRALAEKLSALLTEKYLAARASRESRRTFPSALDWVIETAVDDAAVRSALCAVRS
jgi:hypothetical protein